MHWNTVTPLLQDVLKQTMSSEVFDQFRLVGGTSLSLRIGHRESADIDLFTDSPYDSIDFTKMEKAHTSRTGAGNFQIEALMDPAIVFYHISNRCSLLRSSSFVL